MWLVGRSISTTSLLRGCSVWSRRSPPTFQKEFEIIRFRGRYYATGAGGIVSFDEPQFGARDQLPADLVFGAADVAMNGVPIEGISWLDHYDAYYYDRDRRLSLPVLRVRYDDPQHTWLYFDPSHGAIARKEERLTRLNRWLYHGFHSLDFPFLYYHRPLWDVVVDRAQPGRRSLERHDVERIVAARAPGRYFGVAILKG